MIQSKFIEIVNYNYDNNNKLNVALFVNACTSLGLSVSTNITESAWKKCNNNDIKPGKIILSILKDKQTPKHVRISYEQALKNIKAKKLSEIHPSYKLK